MLKGSTKVFNFLVFWVRVLCGFLRWRHLYSRAENVSCLEKHRVCLSSVDLGVTWPKTFSLVWITAGQAM